MYVTLAFTSGFARVYIGHRGTEYSMSFLMSQGTFMPNFGAAVLAAKALQTE